MGRDRVVVEHGGFDLTDALLSVFAATALFDATLTAMRDE
jgi:hypothetical protein